MLGVSPDAGADEIRAAYRAKAKAAHPDTGGSEEAFGDLNQAHRVLSDPKTRERYDATGEIDDGAPDNSEARGLNQISATLVQVLFAQRDLTGLDVVAILSREISKHIDKASAALAAQQRALGRLKRMEGKFHRLGLAGRDALPGILAWQKDFVGKRAVMLEGEIADLKRAQQILAGYGYERTEPTEPAGPPVSGYKIMGRG